MPHPGTSLIKYGSASFFVPDLRRLLEVLAVKSAARITIQYTCTDLLPRVKNHLYATFHLPLYSASCAACLPLIISNADGVPCTILSILLCFDGRLCVFALLCFDGPRSLFNRSLLVLQHVLAHAWTVFVHVPTVCIHPSTICNHASTVLAWRFTSCG